MCFAWGLSALTLWLDRSPQFDFLDQTNWLYLAGADGARETLSVIASSMITIAGVAFSITIVALTLASNQFGPRVLRTFMKDRGNQMVLGTFIGTFLYSILILRAVRATDQNQLVPHLSVSVSIGFSIAAVVVFIYFIHHVSSIIQVDYIIQNISHDLEDSIEDLYPSEIGKEVREQDQAARISALVEDLSRDSRYKVDIEAEGAGYVQFLNGDELLEQAIKRDLVIHALVRPGAYVSKQQIILQAYSDQPLQSDLPEEIRGTIVLESSELMCKILSLAFLNWFKSL